MTTLPDQSKMQRRRSGTIESHGGRRAKILGSELLPDPGVPRHPVGRAASTTAHTAPTGVPQ